MSSTCRHLCQRLMPVRARYACCYEVALACLACEACNKNKMEQLYRLVNGAEEAQNEVADDAGNSMCTSKQEI